MRAPRIARPRDAATATGSPDALTQAPRRVEPAGAASGPGSGGRDLSEVPVSAGRPLDPATRSGFEAGLGADFSAVRVRNDGEADRTARGLNALAYTRGSDIGFAAGQYAPGRPEGRRLLAHELAHVAQFARRGRGGLAAKRVSQPGDAAEREADAAAETVLAGGRFEVREAPSAGIARQPAPTSSPVYKYWPPPPFVDEAVFEPLDSKTPDGARAAMDAYMALSTSQKKEAVDHSFGNGKLAATLKALDPTLAQNPPYLEAVQGLLREIEARETRDEALQTDAEMADTQAAFMKAQPAAQKGGNWGGAAPGKTRWESLTKGQKKKWTKRGAKAIDLMVAYAAKSAPQLALTAASFELDFEAVDSISMGAFATGGSKPRETVMVGFEFVVICEVNPGYALSTIEHELHGHPVFDAAGGNTSGRIYEMAAKKVPGSPSGTETYEYYPSEIYSLMREVPLFQATAAADAATKVKLPDGEQAIDDLNPDPRTLMAQHVRQMKKKWDPSLLEPMLRGFWQRVNADPGIRPSALLAFSGVLTKVLGSTLADKITR